MGLFTTIRNAWKIADLRKKMFFTLLIKYNQQKSNDIQYGKNHFNI